MNLYLPTWQQAPAAPIRPAIPPDYGLSLFWSIVNQIGGTVGTITLREELVRLIRAGSYAEAYVMALQHDEQRAREGLCGAGPGTAAVLTDLVPQGGRAEPQRAPEWRNAD